MVDALSKSAEVAEQADASVSKTDVRKDVRVRLPLSAPVQGLFGFWRGGQPSHLTTMDPNTRQLGLPA